MLVHLLDEMDKHLCVCYGSNRMAVGLELSFDGKVVLDDAIVDDCNFFSAIPVGVGVDVIRLAVGCPAGMADAKPGVIAILPDALDEIRHLPGFLNDGEAFLADERYSGGIITAIFEPPKALEKYRKGVFSADIADYSAYGINSDLVVFENVDI